MASAKAIAAHNATDNQEAASIGARVDSKSGRWYDLKDGHHIGAAEADQRLGRTTAQGNADRSQGNGGGWLDQLVSRNQDSVGNLLKNIAPVAGLIPGVGPLIAGGLAAGGQALIPGANLGDAIKSGVQGGAMGAGVGTVGKALGGVAGMLGGGSSAAVNPADITTWGAGTGGSSLPGASSIGSLIGKLPSGGGQGDQSGGGVLGFLGGNNGLNALGVAQGVNAAALGEKANNYADQAANLATSRWNAQAPLRTAGVAGMLNPQSPIQAPPIPGGNPFTPQAVPPAKVGP